MPRSSHYQGERGALYFELQQAFPRNVKTDLDAAKFRRFVSGHPTKIVDFGCADGLLLSKLPAEERIGVEAIAENRAAAGRRGVDVRERLAEIQSEWADLVVSHHTLEHVQEPMAELREMRRILRPGGQLIVYVPADDWRNKPRYTPGDINHHLYAWTPLTLGNLLEEAGFDVTDCHVERRALPGRLTPLLVRFPGVFNLASRATALVFRRREIACVAYRPTED